MGNQLKKPNSLQMPIEKSRKPRNSFIVPQNMGGANKRIDDLETIINVFKSSLSKMETKMISEISKLKCNKAERIKVDDSISETASLKLQFMELDKLVQHNQDSIIKRL